MKNSKRNWIPKRRGAIYCSPACGGKCTWTDYQKAKQDAQKLVKLLKGPGPWKIRVWENLGWYFSVSSGPITVYQNNEYWCFISDDPNESGYGCTAWGEPHKLFKDPNKAIQHALKYVKATVSRFCAVLITAQQASNSH